MQRVLKNRSGFKPKKLPKDSNIKAFYEKTIYEHGMALYEHYESVKNNCPVNLQLAHMLNDPEEEFRFLKMLITGPEEGLEMIGPGMARRLELFDPDFVPGKSKGNAILSQKEFIYSCLQITNLSSVIRFNATIGLSIKLAINVAQ